MIKQLVSSTATYPVDPVVGSFLLLGGVSLIKIDKGRTIEEDRSIQVSSTLRTYNSNSRTEVVLAAWAKGQFPGLHLIALPGESWLVEQYAAAAYCSIKLKVVNKPESMARQRKYKTTIKSQRSVSLHFLDKGEATPPRTTSSVTKMSDKK
jgi:hypothetical protein